MAEQDGSRTSADRDHARPGVPKRGIQGGLWLWQVVLLVPYEGHGSAAAQHHDDSDDDNDEDDGTDTYVHGFLFLSESGTPGCRRKPSTPYKAFQPAAAP